MLTAPAHDTEPAAECQLTTPILIDTDPGIDDALAILLAFGSPEVSVKAITTVAGNVEVSLGSDNIFRILDVVRPALRPRPRAGRRHTGSWRPTAGDATRGCLVVLRCSTGPI